jgi:hypothetical protein
MINLGLSNSGSANHPTMTSFSLGLSNLLFELGRVEVEALARGLGRGLTHLELCHCRLEPDFWGALAEHCPHLEEVR